MTLVVCCLLFYVAARDKARESANEGMAGIGFFSARSFGTPLLQPQHGDDSGNDARGEGRGLMGLEALGGWFSKGHGVEV